MRDLIQRVLDHCGYDLEPTEDSLKECFLDYTASGIFSNLDYDEAKEMIDEGEISINTMCSSLLRVR